MSSRSFVVLGPLLACAHAAGYPSPSGGPSQFPSREELQALAGKAGAGDAFGDSTVAVQAWDLLGPFPASPVPEAVVDGSPFGRVLAEALAGHPELQATQSLACVARELGRFYLEKGANAPPALQRFVRGRCLDVQNELRLTALPIIHATASDDNALAAQLRDQLADVLPRGATGSDEIGLWFGRKGDEAVVFVATAPRAVNVVSATLPSGRAVLDLELLAPAAHIEALFNRGALGVGSCEITGRLPLAHVACAFAPGDERTWLDVEAYPPEHILGFPVLDMLAWPQGGAGNHWQAPAIATARPLDAANARATLAEAINAKRTQAGLRRLKLARAESDTLDAVAPVYFASLLGKAPAGLADRVALGAMAGWDVDGEVKNGAFASSSVTGSNDAGALLAELEAYPASRRTIFEPSLSALAVAALVAPGTSGVAVTVGGYEIFGDAPGEEEAARVWKALAEARAAAGSERASVVSSISPLAAEAARKIHEGADTREALNGLVQGSSEALRQSVRGWILETSSLEKLPFPPELVKGPELPLAVGVTWRKRAGEPWGSYVVLLVAIAPGRQLAMLPPLQKPRG